MGIQHIAIIDDDEDFRLSLEGLLDSYGYRVTMFGSAMDFLAQRHAVDIDCIISDIQMPGLTGLQLAAHMRAARSELPIILLSAYATNEVRGRALALGVRRVLGKPLDVEQLVAFIAGLPSVDRG